MNLSNGGKYIRSRILACLAALVILGASCVGCIAGMNYAGICVSKFERLSERELMTVALLHINSIDFISVKDDNGSYYGAKRLPIFSDVDQFLSSNPSCCHLTMGLRIGDEPPPPKLFSRFLGLYRGDANIMFQASYTDNLGTLRTKTVESKVQITNCGSIAN